MIDDTEETLCMVLIDSLNARKERAKELTENLGHCLGAQSMHLEADLADAQIQRLRKRIETIFAIKQKMVEKRRGKE